MTNKNIYTALSQIDPCLIADSAPQNESKKAVKALSPWIKWASLAACFCLIIAASAFTIYQIQNKSKNVSIFPDIEQETYADGGVCGMTPDTPMPYMHPLHYNDYDELISAIDIGFDSEFYSQNIGEEYPEMRKRFADFVATLQTNGVPIPLSDNSRIQLRSKEGFSNISLFIYEQFKLPWIWYYPAVSTGKNYFIQVTYIPENISEELKKGSISELVRAIDPQAITEDNYQSIQAYSNVYQSELTLKDRTVTALIYEYTEDTRKNIMFAYDDLLVMVRADTALWNEQWFSLLSFEKCFPQKIESEG